MVELLISRLIPLTHVINNCGLNLIGRISLGMGFQLEGGASLHGTCGSMFQLKFFKAEWCSLVPEVLASGIKNGGDVVEYQ